MRTYFDRLEDHTWVDYRCLLGHTFAVEWDTNPVTPTLTCPFCRGGAFLEFVDNVSPRQMRLGDDQP